MVNLLHGSVWVTADVPGDHNQTARMEAGQKNHQVDLEPQLIVSRLEEVELGGKSRQSEVQHGVSHGCVFDDGYVFLNKKKGEEWNASG